MTKKLCGSGGGGGGGGEKEKQRDVFQISLGV